MNALSLSAVAGYFLRLYRLLANVHLKVAPNSTAIGVLTWLIGTEPAYLQFCNATAIVPPLPPAPRPPSPQCCAPWPRHLIGTLTPAHASGT